VLAVCSDERILTTLKAAFIGHHLETDRRTVCGNTYHKVIKLQHIALTVADRIRMIDYGYDYDYGTIITATTS